MKQTLRALKSLAGPFPLFDPDAAPDEPNALFVSWLHYAIEAGVIEPHAMTLSTVDEDGCPDARVLILKNLDERGWHFATTMSGPKGRQLEANPNVALTFYWPQLGRQVRIRGTAVNAGSAERDTDFLARPIGSRAAALLARQSDVLLCPNDLEAGTGQARQHLIDDPGLIAQNWAVFCVVPRDVEFFQGDAERRHQRLLYRRVGLDWVRERLWP
ncbi:pyridoxine/pyridoxamine 5'-phosphate oxidase [Rhizobium tumorigenes]|uniref:pyridoxine/pyridoxamine 5'-phosphate oxidase n=1 Tax=Rhizobium tumorigenes TaxID=2041385 RepID=UPI00241CF35D|nr:pyridoxal 5'-phosphate synthase [Rhizobium tumorigenes]WFS03441.1 pyridoxal 5'-phosphate synthase [Rhizobium tumorigenes]